MSKQLSSVEWLGNRIDEILELYPSERQLLSDAIKQAKAIQEQQIRKAWKDGRDYAFSRPLKPYKKSEQYYNETFKQSETPEK